MMTSDESPDPETLREIAGRIVKAVQPRRIVLFGSAARGTMGPHSDLDLLVIMPNGIRRRQVEQQVFRSLMGMGLAKDIVLSRVRGEGWFWPIPPYRWIDGVGDLEPFCQVAV